MSGRKLSRGWTPLLTIFWLTLLVTATRAAAQQEKILHSFGTAIDGPYASVIFDAAGNLYGTTINDGVYNFGSVFELTPQAGGGWALKTPHSFHNNNGVDGTYPYSSLTFDVAGNLYGTTEFGGTYSQGTVFELTPKASGGWTDKVLHSFSPNGIDGYQPFAGLVLDAAGNLYGTTAGGGATGVSGGTVFKLTPQGGGNWMETVLYSFCSQSGCADGRGPFASLILDAAGNLYGTTESGGAGSCQGGCGTVFELIPQADGNWTEKVLHSFTGQALEGALPSSGLTFDSAGNIYGTTSGGGAHGYGTVFKLTAAAGGGWTEATLHAFNNNGVDGTKPGGSLIFDSVGNLYGTTSGGGAYGFGTAFELLPRAAGIWTEKILHNFNFNGTDGIGPASGLVFGAAGNLYGTTFVGGAHGYGTVFDILP